MSLDILCFWTSQRTQHLRHQNTCVVVFMYGTYIHIYIGYDCIKDPSFLRIKCEEYYSQHVTTSTTWRSQQQPSHTYNTTPSLNTNYSLNPYPVCCQPPLQSSAVVSASVLESPPRPSQRSHVGIDPCTYLE